MVEAAFDTIAEVQRLRDVGFKQDQAEAITRSIHAGVTGGVATKADLRMVEAGLRGDMARLEGDLRIVETSLRGEIAKVEGTLRTEISDLRTELKEDIAGLRTEVKSIETRIAEGQTAQLRWMAGLTVAMFAAVVSVLGTVLFL